MATPTRRPRRARRVTLVAAQGAAVGVGAVFLILGVAGFVPGLTSGLNHLQWLGHHDGGATAELFGVFDTSVSHNLLHLGSGVAGLVLARTYPRARIFLIGGGLLYLGLWLWGVMDHTPRQVLPLDQADNWLHLAAGVVMVVLGLTLAGGRVPTGADGELLIPD